MFRGNPYKKLHISSPFGEKRDYGTHKGVDYVGEKAKTKIKPILDGIVSEVGENKTYGKYIKILHNLFYLCNIKYKGFLHTYYYHLHNIDVKEGSYVRGNESIMGTMGNTGFCMQNYKRVTPEQQADPEFTGGTHLHLGVRRGNEWVDPIKFMEEL